MSANRGHSQSLSQDRSQSRGQKRTRDMRIGLDDLDVSEAFDEMPGPEPASQDLGAEDDADGDLMLVDGDDPDADDAVLSVESEEETPAAAPGDTRLEELLGARRPVVVLRLQRVGDDLQAQPTLEPRTEAAEQALQALCRFVEGVFRTGRSRLSEDQWDQLLGARPATWGQRLLALAALRVSPSDSEVGNYSSRVGKFAALPDGTPFHLGLLLRDGRGKKGSPRPDDRITFEDLPRARQLQLVRQILRDEARGTIPKAQHKALSDADVFQQVLFRLEEDGLQLAVPPDAEWKDKMSRFRENLKKDGLGHIFPKAADRDRASARQRKAVAAAQAAHPQEPSRDTTEPA